MTLHSASTLIKGEARESLLGHLPITVGANTLYLLLSVLLTLLVSGAVPGDGWVYLVCANVFLFLADIVIGTLDYGLLSIYMSLQYRQRTTLADLFRGFRENSWTIVRVQAVISAISLAASLPTTIVNEYYGSARSEHLPVVIAFEALTVLVALWINLNYSLIWFVLLDYPALTWREVLKGSRHLMKGNRRVLFYIWLSLIPLYLVSVMSLGIAALWVLAYQHAAVAAFYRGLVNARKR